MMEWVRRRPRIYRFLREIGSPLLPGRGPEVLIRRLRDRPSARILNVGSGPLDHGLGIINVDRKRFPNVHVQADAGALPFRDGSVDAIISEATLEHIPDPLLAVREMRRVLRPGGLLYLSVPFLQPLHGGGGDFARWTLPGTRRLLDGMDILEEGVAGGPTATLVWIISEYAGILLSFGSGRIQSGISLLLRALLSPLKVVDLLLGMNPTAAVLASLVYLLAEEPDRA